MANFTLVQDESGRSLTVLLSDGDLLTVPETHTNFEKVLSLLITDATASDESIRDLADIVIAAGTRLTALSDRVALAGNTILFDGDPIQGPVASNILRLLAEGNVSGWRGLVAFLDKVSQNPRQESREDLYTWLERQGLVITESGNFIGYRGARRNDNGVPESIHQGPAFVDGVAVNGHVPNAVGSTVSIGRSQVEHDRHVACASGLHVGDYTYASEWARDVLLTVEVDPRDVVSVPVDENTRKMRVSKFKVLMETDVEYTAPVWSMSGSDDDSEYDEYDEYGEDSDDYWGDDSWYYGYDDEDSDDDSEYDEYGEDYEDYDDEDYDDESYGYERRH